MLEISDFESPAAHILFSVFHPQRNKILVVVRYARNSFLSRYLLLMELLNRIIENRSPYCKPDHTINMRSNLEPFPHLIDAFSPTERDDTCFLRNSSRLPNKHLCIFFLLNAL